MIFLPYQENHIREGGKLYGRTQAEPESFEAFLRSLTTPAAAPVPRLIRRIQCGTTPLKKIVVFSIKTPEKLCQYIQTHHMY